MFVWDERYSVGIPLIDVQHQKLLEIANSIGEKISNLDDFTDETFEEIMDILDQLFDYTKYHFSQEELLMHHYGYDHVQTHILEHNDFIAYIHGVDYVEINNNPKAILLELIQFVAKWVFNHIMQTDFLFKDFMILAIAKEKDNI